MELKRREFKDDPIRQLELAAYFTHCNLRTCHTRLALLNAMIIFVKAGNLSTAATFASRFLGTNPTTSEDQAKKASQVVLAAKTARNRGDVSPFVVCGATYVPIYRGQKHITCPYCGTHFVASRRGKL
ncbi:OLC1v1038094C1 [Oldenlandia corymbosa var. corymbosa]|uniref:OLC1v1038094C1 n=1 Tax=Oldenlandia corymbosa var. corymbosa TaxID=529605 RepID=A0AAV1CZ51_OLDCO|nr:OLC1v1038094C1 [Oldenlandia corymbosa var. corymbosa]